MTTITLADIEVDPNDLLGGMPQRNQQELLEIICTNIPVADIIAALRGGCTEEELEILGEEFFNVDKEQDPEAEEEEEDDAP